MCTFASNLINSTQMYTNNTHYVYKILIIIFVLIYFNYFIEFSYIYVSMKLENTLLHRTKGANHVPRLQILLTK